MTTLSCSFRQFEQIDSDPILFFQFEVYILGKDSSDFMLSFMIISMLCFNFLLNSWKVSSFLTTCTTLSELAQGAKLRVLNKSNSNAPLCSTFSVFFKPF